MGRVHQQPWLRPAFPVVQERVGHRQPGPAARQAAEERVRVVCSQRHSQEELDQQASKCYSVRKVIDFSYIQ